MQLTWPHLCCPALVFVFTVFLAKSPAMMLKVSYVFFCRSLSGSALRSSNCITLIVALYMLNCWSSVLHRLSAISIGLMTQRCTETSRWLSWRLNLLLNMWFAHLPWRGWVTLHSISAFFSLTQLHKILFHDCTKCNCYYKKVWSLISWGNVFVFCVTSWSSTLINWFIILY